MSTDDPRTPELPDDLADDGVDAELAATLRRSLHEAADAVEPTTTWATVASRLDDDARHPRWVTAPRALVAVAAAAALLLGAISVLDDADDDQTVEVGADPTAPAASARRSIVAVTDGGSLVAFDPDTDTVHEIAEDVSGGRPISRVSAAVTSGPWVNGASRVSPSAIEVDIALEGIGVSPIAVSYDAPGTICNERILIAGTDDWKRGASVEDNDALRSVRGTSATFSPDGSRLAYVSYDDPAPGMLQCQASIVVAGTTRAVFPDLHTTDPALSGPANWVLPGGLVWASDGRHLGFNRSYEGSTPYLLDTETGEETDLTPVPADVPDGWADRSWRVAGVEDADTYWLQGDCYADCRESGTAVLAVDGDEVTAIERPADQHLLSIDPATGRLLFATVQDIQCVEAPCEPTPLWHLAQSIDSEESTSLDDLDVHAVEFADWGPPLAADAEATATTAPPHPTPGDGPQVTATSLPPHPTPSDGPQVTATTWTPSQTAIDDCIQMIEEGGAVVSDDLADLPPAAICDEMLTLAGPGVVVAPVGPCPPGGMELPHGIAASGILTQPDVPEAVVAARFAIFQAAAECDWDALEALMADDFTWSFGDDAGAGSARSALEDLQAAADAAGEPGPLQLIVGLLSLDPWDRDGAWTWPGEMGWNESAFVEGNPGLDDLAAVVGDEAMAQLLDVKSYLGWRLVILEDGTWNAFVAGD